jgi:hypothetical protein
MDPRDHPSLVYMTSPKIVFVNCARHIASISPGVDLEDHPSLKIGRPGPTFQ